MPDIRDRSHTYGEYVRAFDASATPQELRYCADQFRDNYQSEEVGSPAYNKAVQDAAFCESLAERKEGQRPK